MFGCFAVYFKKIWYSLWDLESIFFELCKRATHRSSQNWVESNYVMIFLYFEHTKQNIITMNITARNKDKLIKIKYFMLRDKMLVVSPNDFLLKPLENSNIFSSKNATFRCNCFAVKQLRKCRVWCLITLKPIFPTCLPYGAFHHGQDCPEITFHLPLINKWRRSELLLPARLLLGKCYHILWVIIYDLHWKAMLDQWTSCWSDLGYLVFLFRENL